MASDKQRSPFLQQIREAIRVRHYSRRTEKTYVDWAYRFILFQYEPGHTKSRNSKNAIKSQAFVHPFVLAWHQEGLPQGPCLRE